MITYVIDTVERTMYASMQPTYNFLFEFLSLHTLCALFPFSLYILLYQLATYVSCTFIERLYP